MDKGNLITLIIALSSTLGLYLTNRASAKASMTNTSVTARVELEKEAYDRARKYDTDTIERQDAEIEELRRELHEVKEQCELQIRDLKTAHAIEVGMLRTRIARIERGLPPDSEEEIREREERAKAEFPPERRTRTQYGDD